MASPIHHIFIKNKQIINIEEFAGNHADDIVIYEVVRLINGKILFLEDHLDRFYNSLNYTGLKNNYARKEILDQLGLLIRENQIKSGNIRFEVIVNHITKVQEFLAYFIAHSYPTEEQYKNGVAVAITEAFRNNPHAKRQHSSLLETVNHIIQKEKVYEVIMIHPGDYVTEGSRSNLFMIKDNRVLTSPEKDILPGITRKYILQVCENLHIECEEKRITRNELFSMDALFITGTSPKVLSISNIADKNFDVNHPMLRSIMKEFDSLLVQLLAISPKFISH
jgi:branched-chain amino acid aminotransferase